MRKIHWTIHIIFACVLSFAYGATHPGLIDRAEPDNGYANMLDQAQSQELAYADSFAPAKKAKR